MFIPYDNLQNIFINGNLAINQRFFSSGTLTTSPVWNFDRWFAYGGTGGSTIALSSDVPTNNWSPNSLLLTWKTGETDIFIGQRISQDRAINLNNRMITVSFMVKNGGSAFAPVLIINQANANGNFTTKTQITTKNFTSAPGSASGFTRISATAFISNVSNLNYGIEILVKIPNGSLTNNQIFKITQGMCHFGAIPVDFTLSGKVGSIEKFITGLPNDISSTGFGYQEMVYDGQIPLKLSASIIADSKINIASNVVTTINGSATAVPPFADSFAVFPVTTVDMQTGATTGGTVNNSIPSSTIGKYRRVLLSYSSTNQLYLTWSTEVATLNSLASPDTLVRAGDFILGYLDLEATGTIAFKTAGSSSNIIENAVTDTPRIVNFLLGGTSTSNTPDMLRVAILDQSQTNISIIDMSTKNAFSIEGWVSIDATTDLREYFCIDGVKKGDGTYVISAYSVGDNCGVVFNITSAGVIQYTSTTYSGFVSAEFRYVVFARQASLTQNLTVFNMLNSQTNTVIVDLSASDGFTIEGWINLLAIGNNKGEFVRINGTKKGDGTYTITAVSTGDDSLVTFGITNSGVLTYSTPTYANFSSLTFSYLLNNPVQVIASVSIPFSIIDVVNDADNSLIYSAGEWTFKNSAGYTRLDITDAGIPTFSGLSGTGLVHSISGTFSVSQLVNADVSVSAAIDGTKISPAFGAQDITLNSGQKIDTTAASGTLNIATANATTINIGKAGATVNILGSLAYIETTNTQVTDSLLTLNKGGAVGSASSSGIEFEENSLITGYVKTSSDRNSLQIKAPNSAGNFNITPSGFDCSLISNATVARLINLPDRAGTINLSDSSDTLLPYDSARTLGNQSNKWSAIYLADTTTNATGVTGNISGLLFSDTQRSFVAHIAVITSGGLYESFLMEGIRKASNSWFINVTSVGDNTGITFDTTNGQVTFANAANGWVIKAKQVSIIDA